MKPKSITTKNGETKKFKAAGSWLFHKATESTGLDNFNRTGFYLTGKKIVSFLVTKSSLDLYLINGDELIIQSHFIPYTTERQIKALAGRLVSSLKQKPAKNGKR